MTYVAKALRAYSGQNHCDLCGQGAKAQWCDLKTNVRKMVEGCNANGGTQVNATENNQTRKMVRAVKPLETHRSAQLNNA